MPLSAKEAALLATKLARDVQKALKLEGRGTHSSLLGAISNSLGYGPWANLKRKAEEEAQQPQILDSGVWEARFKPIQNEVTENSCCEGQMFETYGDDLAYVRGVAEKTPRKVWTILDCDGKLILTNGMHFVNRMGYLVTRKSAPAGVDFEIPWSYDPEDLEFRIEVVSRATEEVLYEDERFADSAEDALLQLSGEYDEIVDEAFAAGLKPYVRVLQVGTGTNPGGHLTAEEDDAELCDDPDCDDDECPMRVTCPECGSEEHGAAAHTHIKDHNKCWDCHKKWQLGEQEED
jgi:hypothetical protein